MLGKHDGETTLKSEAAREGYFKDYGNEGAQMNRKSGWSSVEDKMCWAGVQHSEERGVRSGAENEGGGLSV